jgi:putative transposase
VTLGLQSTLKTSELLHKAYQKRETCLLQNVYCHIIREYGKHPVSTDGWTWNPHACQFLKLSLHIHSPLEESLIERTM